MRAFTVSMMAVLVLMSVASGPLYAQESYPDGRVCFNSDPPPAFCYTPTDPVSLRLSKLYINLRAGGDPWGLLPTIFRIVHREYGRPEAWWELEEKMGVTRNELKRAVSRYFAIWVEDTLRYVYRSEGGWVSPEKLTEAQLHWWEYIDKQYVPLVVYDALPVVPAKPQ
ncbi:MAG TPA: hypothetical protein VJG29_00070 [Candidatus Paceibacterota bacterium]